jgi:hypothetical protein
MISPQNDLLPGAISLDLTPKVSMWDLKKGADCGQFANNPVRVHHPEK